MGRLPETRGARLARKALLERKELSARLRRGADQLQGRRPDPGTYGKCERCGSPIDELRLRAVPQVRRCMSCAAVR